MKVNYQERIETTTTELKIIMAQRRELYLARQKVHALYLLKCGSSPSITDVAELLGVDRITVQKWLKQYNEGGLSSLLKLRRSKGKVRVISSEVIAEISTKISEESCQFKSYKKIALWGKITIKYPSDIKFYTSNCTIAFKPS